MLDRLRKIFSKGKPELPAEAHDFITKLAASDIWILAIGISGTPHIPPLNDPAALDMIAAHRKELVNLSDDDSVFPFNFQRRGTQFLPFFTSEERAKYFLANSGLGDISIFHPYCLVAGFVTSPENDIFELLLDPCSSSERKIDPQERALLGLLTNAA